MNHRSKSLGTAFGAGSLVILLMLSMGVGSSWHGFNSLADWLFDESNNEFDIIFKLRLARTLAALVVGIALGIAGYLVQTMTRNYLADPGILGINASAAIAVLLGASLFNATLGATTAIWAAVGSSLGILILLIFYTKTKGSALAVILIGLSLTAGLGAVSSFLILTTDQLTAFTAWAMGSVNTRDFSLIAIGAPLIAIAAVLTLLLTKQISLLALGDDQAASMGLNVNHTILLVGFVVALFSAGATAIAGPLLFVGLAAPNLAKFFAGAEVQIGIALSAIFGASLVLFSDVLARIVVKPSEMPLGIILSLTGAITMLLQLRKASEK